MDHQSYEGNCGEVGGEKIYYKEGYKYVLNRDFCIRLPYSPPAMIPGNYFIFYPNGDLFIKKGCPWDGASGPTIDTRDCLRGSLVHNILYHCIRMGWLASDPWRKYADKIALDIWKEDSSCWFFRAIRYPIWWWALRKFACYADDPEAERSELVAP